MEAIRLKDVENLEQQQCADRMQISRQTFQRILGAARNKIAVALLKGKAIRIEGGNFELSTVRNASYRQSCRDSYEESGSMSSFPGCNTFKTEDITLKIAVITEDEKNISQHFGRAPWYVVLSIEDGKTEQHALFWGSRRQDNRQRKTT
jgi:hypothetical protein